MKTRFAFIVLALLSFFYGCKNQKNEIDSIYQYKEYVNYTTSGIVSVTENITVNLAKSIENWEPSYKITSNIIDVKPNISGEVKILNNHSFQFIPDEKLDGGKEYSVTINLKEIYKNISKELETYTFEFKTITPNFLIKTGVLQSYNRDYQYLIGTLKSADIINIEDVNKILKANQEGVVKNIVWDNSYETSKIFEFKIDSIKRNDNNSSLSLSWNGNSINADIKGDSEIVIPGKNQFKVLDVKLHDDNSQYISINFSDKLKKNQNFKGLVTVQNEKNPKFIVNGNELKVFSENRFQGNILISVFEGIKNDENYGLKNRFEETIIFEKIKPQIRAITNGTILPNSNELKFNFEAINVKEVDVRIIKVFEDNVLQYLQEENLNSNNKYALKKVGRRIAKQTIKLIEDEENYQQNWKAYSVDISKLINVDPGSIYRVELSFDRSQVIYDCSNASTVSEKDELNNFDNISDYDDQELREQLYWDNKLYSYKNYTYNWRERNNPCHNAYYSQEKIISQNVLASNLGVIVKKGNDNSYFIAATNLLSAEPEAAAEVKLYNFQQQQIAESSTNSNGITNISTSKNAAFAIVSKGKNKGYLKLFDGNSLSLSKFDVSGSKTYKGIKGFIYGERGVWRPGDSIYLTFVLNDADNKLPKNYPVKLEVTNPRGKLVYRNILSKSVGNFYKFVIGTNKDGETGNYSAKVSVGGANFYKNLKVETVKPNRLKIKVDFKDDILTFKKPIEGNLEVNWLHGTPAKNLKAEIKAKVTSTNYNFKDYKNYIFSDPSRSYSASEVNIFEGRLNEKGKAKISNNLKVGKEAPGMLNIQFLVRAFENGGDFSIDAFTKKYAPYNTFIGLKSPKGNQFGSYFTDEDQTFSVVSVDKDGNYIKNKELKVEVYKIEWRWWWSSSYDNLSKYTSSTYNKPYQSFSIKTDSYGKTNFSLIIPDDDRGRFLIRIIDKEGGHATGRTAYFYKNWWQNESSKNKDAAKMLVFSSDKEKYNVGDIAKITFPSSSKAKALLSIENGTKVIETKWVETKKGMTTVNLPITKEMTPNVFANISLLQPHQSTENDLPIRLYGVIPILVKDENTILNPKIDMPKELKPEEEFTIKISEKTNKEMTYTLAVVEEGLLDLTRFSTPNPYNTFYAREALGIKTWDVFDDVIGAYSGSIDQVFAIGGDGNSAKGKNKKANRFKPVVKFIGPFKLNKGEIKSHKIRLPNYIGSVKTMVVAGDIEREAFGNSEQSTLVKKPLMVLATLPRKLSPKEKVILPISVFTMDNKVNSVNISLKTSGGVNVIGLKSKEIKFDKPDEKMVYFDLDVKNINGPQSVEIIASGAGEKAIHKIEFNVENPNPITAKVDDYQIKRKETEVINFESFGEQDISSALLEISTIPNINFSGRLEYLIQYPHGCLEQTTSSAFPQLYMTDIFDISSSKKQQIQSNIEKAINRLSNFQLANGGFSYWIGENYGNEWGTNYAGHFLLEAEKRGFVLPLTFKSNFINYQKQMARKWRSENDRYINDLTQAYRLYTLAMAGAPDLSAMNRLKEYSKISNEALWRLSAAYALVGQIEAAEEILSKVNYNFAGYNSFNYGSIARNKAMALETLILLNKETKELSSSVAKELSSKAWMSTQTTSYCLLSIGKLVDKNGGKSIDVNLQLNNDNEKIKTKSSLVQRVVKVKKGINSIKVENLGNNLIYSRIINKGKLSLGKEIEQKRGLKVSLVYKDLKGNIIDVRKLKQGQDFVAHISVSNPKNENLKDIALTQIFPSGWEIINTRFTDYGSSVKSKARFTDIKDDRVNFYFDLDKKRNSIDKKTFTVLLNAAYLGKYYLPGVQVEAMYDNDYLYRKKGNWIEVIK